MSIISLGVEKAAIGYAAFKYPKIIKETVESFGKQSIVGVLDIKKIGFPRKYQTMILNGSLKTNMNAFEYARYLQSLGVGEILIQNIDLDGKMSGFDINLIRNIYENIDIPLTVLGGAGSLDDIKNLIGEFEIIGVAAGSLFVFKGIHKAVLINYPDLNQKKKILSVT